MGATFTIAERVEIDGREVWSHGTCDASFSVHNQGAAAILRAIGHEWDSCGTIEAADTVARCVTWRAVGEPAAVTVEADSGVGAHGMRWVECGVDEDYVRTRIGWLEELARVAVASGRQVGWA